MSRVTNWVKQHTQASHETETRLTIRLEAPQHDALKQIADAIGMNKTACATHLLAEAIKEALAEIEANATAGFGSDNPQSTEVDNDNASGAFSHVTTYARMKGNLLMKQLFQEIEASLKLGTDVEMRATSRYFGFWRNGQVFAYVHIKRDHIQIDVKPELPLKAGLIEMAPDTAKVCTRRIIIRTTSDIDAVKPFFHNCYNMA